ncbi:Ribosomal protein S12p Asp88 (E. coli) methylthiotransferase, partial [hydrothermal vent metagenome]
ETKFEKAGAFIYSPEEGTEAFDMPDQISDSIKKERLDRLMKLQQEISKEIQEKYVGEELKVLIEEKQKGEENVYLGRSVYDAPDVDGVVYVKSNQELNPGDFVNVKIIDSLEYDLSGDLV